MRKRLRKRPASRSAEGAEQAESSCSKSTAARPLLAGPLLAGAATSRIF